MDINERIKKLRDVSVTTRPRISIERAVHLTEIYKKYLGKVETPILRALSFENIMEKKSLYIGHGELIVGEKGDGPQVTPTYPELCCHTINDFEIISERNRIFFDVDENTNNIQAKEIIPYWEEMSIRNKIMNEMTEEWLNCYKSGIFTEFMEQRAPGHTVGDDKYYNKGFKKFKLDIENEIDKLDFLNDDEAYNKKVQLKAMSITCDGIITLGKRYAEYAYKLAEKENDINRKSELLQIAKNCEIVPENKPQSFYQAVQMYWFVHLGVTTELNIWDAFSPGRLDQYLYPFYMKDTQEGNLTREEAKEILQCLWIKFNNQPAPPKVGITLKESSTYNDFANINTGGINPYTGENGVNEVSYIILEVMDEMKLTQPNSNVQISEKTPHEFLIKACEISRKGWGQPAFYNTEVIINELINAGKSIEDARFGGASGCVETGSHGREAYILTGYLNLPKILEITLNNGFDWVSKLQLGIKLGEAKDFKTYEEFFNAFKKQLKHFVDIKIKGNNIIERLYAKNMPAPFLSVITDDCIKKGKDYNSGGARYNTRYIQCVGIGTITDSLTALKYNVYDNKKIELSEFIEALKNNYDNYEEIHNIVLNKTPKFGNDDDYADDVMKQIFLTCYDDITGRKAVYGGHYRIDMLPTTCHVYFGSVTGATPNGRLAYKPHSEGISPEKGADTNGPTAVIKSASKMNHEITGGTLLNQKFTPSVIKGEKGLEALAALIKTYFKLKGHHIQFNVIDKNILIDAQNNPEEYNDLIVRVAGYSDFFNNLSKELQSEIIERTEQKL